MSRVWKTITLRKIPPLINTLKYVFSPSMMVLQHATQTATQDLLRAKCVTVTLHRHVVCPF